MKILDRYVLQKFFLPFIYCLLGFIAIWFIFDLSDNLQDFLQGKVDFAVLLAYYKSQVPEILFMVLPMAELLALLYALSAMSRTNEIVSMLGSGLSVVRILVPLMAVGLLLTGVAMYFNYESVPHAAKTKKEMLKEIKRGKKIESGLVAHLYRNREDQRTWFMRKVFPEEQKLSDVQIIQQDVEGNITKQWYAKEARFNPDTQEWTFQTAKYVEVDPEGNITLSEFKPQIVVAGWKESPMRISSSVMVADWLSVPELKDYLSYNADFPPARLAPYQTKLANLWASPWMCLVVVFIAAPLGIVYSRRGILGAVALAVSLFVVLFLSSILFVTLGKGYRINSMVAAWGPVAFFFLIGCGLVWLRSTNRDLPKLKLPWMT